MVCRLKEKEGEARTRVTRNGKEVQASLADRKLFDEEDEDRVVEKPRRIVEAGMERETEEEGEVKHREAEGVDG
jgi:hypothetical protein